jgi:hypothetical protein
LLLFINQDSLASKATSSTTEARFLADGEILLFVTKADQDAHPASDVKGNGGSFLGGKAAKASPPSSNKI